MTRKLSCWPLALLLVLLNTPVWAQATAPADEARSSLRRAAAVWLTVTPGLEVDPELRRGAEALRDGAMPHIEAVIARWLAQARQAAPAAEQPRLRSLYPRLLNALALWQLASAGPEHDRRLQQAHAHPRACQPLEAETASPMDLLVLLWQRMPRAQWAAHLTDEAQLLARFGDEALPPEAEQPGVEDIAWRHLQGLAAGLAPAPFPVSPALAWNHLVAEPAPGRRQGAEDICRRAQWVLHQDLARLGTELPAARWASHRRAMLVSLFGRWVPEGRAATGAGDAYPEGARRLELEGSVTVELVADAAGKRPLHAQVLRRRLRMPGMGVVPPVVFERLLDAESLRRALALPAVAAGGSSRTVEFVYRLQ